MEEQRLVKTNQVTDNTNGNTRNSEMWKWLKRVCFMVVLGALLVHSTFIGIAYAQIGGTLIVYDPKVDGTLKVNFLQTINNLFDQYQQLRMSQEYRELMDGHWYESVGLADLIKTRAAALGISIDELGWSINDKYHTHSATQASASALDELRKIAAGEGDEFNHSKIRDDIEIVNGIAPATTAGVKVDAAYGQIAATIATSGEINKAIPELQDQIREISERLDFGDLPPGDIDRYKAILAAKQMDLETLQLQAQNQNNLLLSHQVGLNASQEVRVENSRLKERYNVLSYRPIFSPEAMEGELDAE